MANPYLDDFYNEMERWSFNLQGVIMIFFLFIGENILSLIGIDVNSFGVIFNVCTKALEKTNIKFINRFNYLEKIAVATKD